MNDPASIITIRLYRTAAPDETVHQIALVEGEGLPYANMLAGALLDTMHDASGEEYGYQVAHALLYPTTPALAPLLRAARTIAAPDEPTYATRVSACRRSRQGDEIFCATCTRRWPADEEPECPQAS